ncbi:hypothetical protein [Variovorax sp. N23]|uniref:hypothetical protein n=1 Tax=Variovorax sp. N23 TaxID=2980555 RepID=UPI0021C5889B|nr:hypothetical protein [Variovorax sp. N23]MCU4121465.1 hypothetical protein [Variovorax sp. N23]
MFERFWAVLGTAALTLATFIAGIHTERYKSDEAQRAAAIDAFDHACTEVWAAVYAYEREASKLDETRLLLRLTSAPPEDPALSEAVAQARTNAFSAITARRYLLGETYTQLFQKYVGLVNVRSEAYFSAETAQGDAQRKINRDATVAFTEMLALMRFDSRKMRGVSKIPMSN